MDRGRIVLHQITPSGPPGLERGAVQAVDHRVSERLTALLKVADRSGRASNRSAVGKLVGCRVCVSSRIGFSNGEWRWVGSSRNPTVRQAESDSDRNSLSGSFLSGQGASAGGTSSELQVIPRSPAARALKPRAILCFPATLLFLFHFARPGGCLHVDERISHRIG